MTLIECVVCGISTDKVINQKCTSCIELEIENLVNQIQKIEDSQKLQLIEPNKVETCNIAYRESNIKLDLTTSRVEEKLSVKISQNNHDDAFVAIGVGTAAGVATSATIGGMGLLVAGTGVGIGLAPIAAVGAITGTAIHTAKKAIEEKDGYALGAVVAGASVGAGVSSVVGGMGLAVAGTAVGIGMAPVAAVGAVVGLAGYGIFKLFGGQSNGKKKKRKANRIKKISKW